MTNKPKEAQEKKTKGELTTMRQLCSLSLSTQTRADLASYINVPLKHLTYVLYGLDRSQAYRVTTIPKASGKIRTLHKVSTPLKQIQRSALDALQTNFKPSPYAHGFVAKSGQETPRSIISNASHHCRKRCLIKVDIQDFFHSIHFARVQGMFKAKPFQFGSEFATTLAQMACVDDEQGLLPQGGVLSPYISNMICRRLDSRLAKLAQDYHCHFTRYADDITFSTNDIKKLNPEKLIQSIYAIIEEEHFIPNKEKTKVLWPKDRQIVTGVIVNDGLNVNRRYIRDLRAILYNCKKEGIASQIVKKGVFKDSRSSRLNIEISAENTFYYNGQPIDPEAACILFLKHLYGRIDFVGQVVNFKRDKNSELPNKRVHIYENLLLSFYSLICKDTKYRKITDVVLKKISKHPHLIEKLSGFEEIEVIKINSLKEYKKEVGAKLKTEVEILKSKDEIDAFINQQSKIDPRFLQKFPQSSVDELKKSVIKIISYPKIDQNKTVQFLHSLRDSSNFGALTHASPDENPLTGRKVLELYNTYYYPIYYYLNFEVRKEFDTYFEYLKEIILKKGLDEKVDVLNNELEHATKSLKKNTRMGGNSQESTSISAIFNHAQSYAENKVTKNQIIIEPKIVKTKRRIYTHVPSIQWALNNIFHSMLSNSNGTCVSYDYELLVNEEKFKFTIFDNGSAEVDGSDISINGKLCGVIKKLNGLCDYFIEANFIDGRKRINMMNGHEEQPLNTEKGFVHELIFQLEKG